MHYIIKEENHKNNNNAEILPCKSFTQSTCNLHNDIAP